MLSKKYFWRKKKELALKHFLSWCSRYSRLTPFPTPVKPFALFLFSPSSYFTSLLVNRSPLRPAPIVRRVWLFKLSRSPSTGSVTFWGTPHLLSSMSVICNHHDLAPPLHVWITGQTYRHSRRLICLVARRVYTLLAEKEFYFDEPLHPPCISSRRPEICTFIFPSNCPARPSLLLFRRLELSSSTTWQNFQDNEIDFFSCGLGLVSSPKFIWYHLTSLLRVPDGFSGVLSKRLCSQCYISLSCREY